MAICAREVQQAALGIVELLALFVGGKRARVVTEVHRKRFAARRIGHVGRNRRYRTLLVLERLLTVGLAAQIDRIFERHDLAAIGVEVRVILAYPDTAVGETVGIALAIGKWRIEQLLALLDRQFVRRELLDLQPLLIRRFIQRINAIGVIFQCKIGKTLFEVLDERFAVGLRVSQQLSRQKRRKREYKRKNFLHN